MSVIKNKLIFIIGFLYMLSLYSTLGLLWYGGLSEKDITKGDSFFLILMRWFLVLNILLGIIAIVFIVITRKKLFLNQDIHNSLNKMALIIKISLIPFFIITLISVFPVFLVGTMLIFPIPILFVYAFIVMTSFYCIVLVTSSFTILNLWIEYKNKQICLISFIFFLLLQLIFVLDILSYFILYFKIRKNLQLKQNINSSLGKSNPQT